MYACTISVGAVNEGNWFSEQIVTAVIAAIAALLLWWFQDWRTNKRSLKKEKEELARVWGLALFELREAIERSLNYATNLAAGKVSYGVPFFAKTISSDYFKMYTDLSVAKDMHWLYSIMNQIQENLKSSRQTDEITRLRNGQSIHYAGAASAFATDYKNQLIQKYNRCLEEWNGFRKKNKIVASIELEYLRDR